VANATITPAPGIFEIEQQGDTLIVVPTEDRRELDFQRIEASAAMVFDSLDLSLVKNVVLDR
jgi:hypothetical protein